MEKDIKLAKLSDMETDLKEIDYSQDLILKKIDDQIAQNIATNLIVSKRFQHKARLKQPFLTLWYGLEVKRGLKERVIGFFEERLDLILNE